MFHYQKRKGKQLLQIRLSAQLHCWERTPGFAVFMNVLSAAALLQRKRIRYLQIIGECVPSVSSTSVCAPQPVHLCKRLTTSYASMLSAAALVRVTGADPRLAKAHGRAFFQAQNSVTAISVSGGLSGKTCLLFANCNVNTVRPCRHRVMCHGISRFDCLCPSFCSAALYTTSCSC